MKGGIENYIVQCVEQDQEALDRRKVETDTNERIDRKHVQDPAVGLTGFSTILGEGLMTGMTLIRRKKGSICFSYL